MALRKKKNSSQKRQAGAKKPARRKKTTAKKQNNKTLGQVLFAPFQFLLKGIGWILRHYPFAGWGFLILLILSFVLFINVIFLQPKYVPEKVFFQLYDLDSQKILSYFREIF